MPSNLIDVFDSVPDVSVMLYLGAATESLPDGRTTVKLDSEEHTLTSEEFHQAESISRALRIRDRKVEFATEVLAVRRDAVNLLHESIFVSKDDFKILFVPAGESAGSFYRSRLPMEFLTQANSNVVAHWTARLDISKALRYDVLWIQLSSGPLLHKIAHTAQAEGVKVIYDIDDRWDTVVGEDNPAGRLFYQEQIKNIEGMISLADLVTVSTEPLRKYVLEKGAKKATVIPNMIPTPIWATRDIGHPKITQILWAGSPTHKQDLEVAAPALCKILERNDGKVRFVCFGENVPESLESVRHFVDTVRFVDFADYAELLAQLGADVAIAPLVDNDFNACKSAVKFLEYAGSGYPVLCSPVGEYSVMDEIGAPITLVDDDEWERALTLAISDQKWRKSMGHDAQAWVRKNRCLAGSKAQDWFETAWKTAKGD